MFNIGLKIKELMRKENMDAPTLAKRLNKSKQAIYDMLEKKDLNTSILRELAEIFKVPVTYFLTDGEEILLNSQEEVDSMRMEITSLKNEIERLRVLKFPTKDSRVYDLWMKFMDVTFEMQKLYIDEKGGNDNE